MSAARASNGSFALTYLPQVRTIRVDLRRLAGSMQGSWFDPTDGSLKSVSGSPFTSSSIREFAPTEKNADGGKDWVLVLEAVTQ